MITTEQSSVEETDIYRHIHVENNILFSKAIKLEQYCAIQ